MALMQPQEVLNRVKKVQEQANSAFTKGILYYLRAILCDCGVGYCKQNFVNNIVDLLEDFDDLPKLILKSAILREYSSEKLIAILNKKISKYCINENLLCVF